MVTLEAHELDTTHGDWCCRCHRNTATTLHLALVAGDSLRLITRVTHTTCPCGHEETCRS